MAAIASSVIIFAAQRKLNQTSLFLSKVYSMTMTLDWVLKLGVGVPLSLTRSLCWPWTWDPGGGGSPWPGRTLGRCTAPPGMLWSPCEGWMESMVSRRREEGIKNRQREYKNVKKKKKTYDKTELLDQAVGNKSVWTPIRFKLKMKLFFSPFALHQKEPDNRCKLYLGCSTFCLLPIQVTLGALLNRILKTLLAQYLRKYPTWF